MNEFIHNFDFGVNNKFLLETDSSSQLDFLLSGNRFLDCGREQAVRLVDLGNRLLFLFFLCFFFLFLYGGLGNFALTSTQVCGHHAA